MSEVKVSNKTADFIHPSPYEVWRRYVYGSSLQNRIGPWKFALFLHKHKAIELFYFREKRKGNLKCRIKQASKIPDLLNQLKDSPWVSPLSWVSQLARRLRTRRTHTSA